MWYIWKYWDDNTKDWKAISVKVVVHGKPSKRASNIFQTPTHLKELFFKVVRSRVHVYRWVNCRWLRRKLNNHLILERLPARFSSDQPNLPQKRDFVEDYHFSYRFSNWFKYVYDCVYCNYGSLMFYLLSSVLMVHCHSFISLSSMQCIINVIGQNVPMDWPEWMERIKNSCLEQIQRNLQMFEAQFPY